MTTEKHLVKTQLKEHKIHLFTEARNSFFKIKNFITGKALSTILTEIFTKEDSKKAREKDLEKE